MADGKWRERPAELEQRAWPEVVEQIKANRDQGARRPRVLTIDSMVSWRGGDARGAGLVAGAEHGR